LGFHSTPPSPTLFPPDLSNVGELQRQKERPPVYEKAFGSMLRGQFFEGTKEDGKASVNLFEVASSF